MPCPEVLREEPVELLEPRLNISMDAPEDRMNVAVHESLDMFATDLEEMEEESPKQDHLPKNNLMMNYQTLSDEDHNISNIRDKTNLLDKVVKVNYHQRKALKYQWDDDLEELPIDEDDPDVAKAKLAPAP